MLALIQSKKGASKFPYKNCWKLKGHEHYKLNSFNQILQYLGKPVTAPQEVLSHGKFGQNFVGGSIKITKISL